MGSPQKKRGRPPETDNNNKTSQDQYVKKIAKIPDDRLDSSPKYSPVKNSSQLLNEIAADDSSLTIKLELDDSFNSTESSENLSKDKDHASASNMVHPTSSQPASLLVEPSASKEPALAPQETVTETGPMRRVGRRVVLPESFWEHFPEEFGAVPGRKRQKIKKFCVLCQKPSETMCPACHVPLCLSSCHRLYHSMLSE